MKGVRYAVLAVPVLLAASAEAQSLLTIQIGGGDQLSVPVKLLLILTLLTILPSLLLCLTSFTRIVIVMSLLRQALGLMHMPPNQVLIGLSLILTYFTMQPVLDTVHREALKPFMEEKISLQEALQRAIPPLKGFMLKQTREKEIALFSQMAGLGPFESPEDVPMRVLVPAFVLSELKTAFQIGFLLYLPFLVIDMVVSSILLSLGIFMLPPMLISLPLKLMLFVLVDGWSLLASSLVRSFG
ncbi:MAG: flagellar biosynthetic protein FliP [Deltaproteobacteria bacterium]|nr:MAG: flagellar biosynthetic protein FliP [Deltaproteobacteria bacterium]